MELVTWVTEELGNLQGMMRHPRAAGSNSHPQRAGGTRRERERERQSYLSPGVRGACQ